MRPLDLRVRSEAEAAELRHALDAAEGRAPSCDDPVARIWTLVAGIIALALVLSLVLR